MITCDPSEFAEWFNDKYPGAYRQLVTEDVIYMELCGLIHRYGYYSGSIDGEIIRGILQYEKLRENRSLKQHMAVQPPSCKCCGRQLLPKLGIKAGRHREYCFDCESHRNRDRQQKLRHRQTILFSQDIIHEHIKSMSV